MRWRPDAGALAAAAAAIRVAFVVAAAAGSVGCSGSGGGAVPGAGDAAPAGSADAGPYVEDGTLADRACPTGTFLTYQNFGAPFFFEYCTGCHSSQIPPDMRQHAPAGVDFETLDDIRASADLIYLRAADGYAIMPPVGGPSPETRVLLGEWLACGAPEQ